MTDFKRLAMAISLVDVTVMAKEVGRIIESVNGCSPIICYCLRAMGLKSVFQKKILET